MAEPLQQPLRWLVTLLVICGLTTVVAQYGFQLAPSLAGDVRIVQEGIVWAFVVVFWLRLGLRRQPWAYLREHKLQTLLVLLLLLDLLALHTTLGRLWLRDLLDAVDVKHLTVLYVAFIQGAIVLLALREGAYYSRMLATWQIRPAQTMALSFAGLILLGSALLLLPRATVQPASIPLLTAVFTATSAVCVTGLIVVDTATYFTPLGQGIILLLCQVGGLGIVTFATVISMMVRGDLGLRDKVFLRDFVTSRQFGEISATVQRIVGLTLLIEALGAASLYYHWRYVLPEPGERLWQATFHAVSAFCNAGFSTFSDNLAGAQTAMHLGINLTVMGLIICGGLGFTVLWEGIAYGRGVLRGRRPRLSVHCRMVCLTTALLILVGAGYFLLLEAHGVLAAHTGGERLLGALFQSVTARTAGFNTLAIEQFSVPTTFLMLILMVIGASPGSTGGGIKTTTLAVLSLTTVAIMRGKARVETFHRTLPWPVINQAYATFFFAIGFITLAMFLLSTTESLPFLDLFFEEVSAFATVGLSRGITATLSGTGQVIIILSMFVGRVGSLTLGVALARQVSTTAYEYPTETVTIG